MFPVLLSIIQNTISRILFKTDFAILTPSLQTISKRFSPLFPQEIQGIHIHLLFGYRQISHRLLRIDVDFQFTQDPRCLCVHLCIRQDNPFALLSSQEHVLRNAQMFAHI